MSASVEVRSPRTLLGTCCVPWTPEYDLDEPRFRAAIRGLVTSGMRDLYIFGTAGEGYAVTDDQFRRISTVFVDELAASGGAPPMIGVISTSLGTVFDRIRFGESLGVREFQFSLPNWGVLDEAETAELFAAVCDGFPESRFLHYNLPRAGRLVTPAEYGVLAERHPNLVATKYGQGAPAVVADLLARAPQLRHFLGEAGFFVGAPLGACGLVASVSATEPLRAARYVAAGFSGSPEFVDLYRELAGMTSALIASVGPGRIDGAYDKVIQRAAQPDFPLHLLPPYRGADAAAADRYAAIVRERFPGWLL